MTAVLVLGSNFQDREKNIRKAEDWLSSIGKIEAHSSIYESADFRGSGLIYMNMVVAFDTHLDPSQLCEKIKSYELGAGRTRKCRERGEVVIDIDIVVADDVILRENDYCAAYFQQGLKQLP